jgi:hypothetical protein
MMLLAPLGSARTAYRHQTKPKVGPHFSVAFPQEVAAGKRAFVSVVIPRHASHVMVLLQQGIVGGWVTRSRVTARHPGRVRLSVSPPKSALSIVVRVEVLRRGRRVFTSRARGIRLTGGKYTVPSVGSAACSGSVVDKEICQWLGNISEYYHEVWHGFVEVGTDFGMNPDTPIYAVQGGRVLGANEHPPGYGGGGVISVEAGPTLSEYYQHLDLVEVKEGDHVSAGQLIGYSGGQLSGGHNPVTCCSGGPHLEWGINANYGGIWHPLGANIDPIPCLTAILNNTPGACGANGKEEKERAKEQESVTGNENVFMRDANGNLEQKWYTLGPNAWSGWLSLGAPAGTALAGDPLVTNTGITGNENVFVAGANGSLYEIWYTPSAHAWSGWLSLGAPSGTTLVGEPFVLKSVTGNENVFMRGANGSLYEIWYTPSAHAWSGWLSLGAPSGTTVAGDPYVNISSVTGNENVFVRAANGSLYQIWYTPSVHAWSGWQSFGAPSGTTVEGDPFVISSVTGNENVFVRAANGNLYQIWYTPSAHAWSGWLSFGAPSGTSLTGDPFVTITGITANENVFMRGANGNLYEIWYTPSAHAWSGWLSLGAPSGTLLASDPFALKGAPGNENVFAGDANGSLQEIWYTPGAGWSGWLSLGAPGGTTLAGDPVVTR